MLLVASSDWMSLSFSVAFFLHNRVFELKFSSFVQIGGLFGTLINPLGAADGHI